MTKQQLFHAFRGDISKSAIIEKDHVWCIVGKFCEIERVGDLWDLYICNPKNMTKGLSQRKVSIIVSELQNHPTKATFTVLNGEAYCQIESVDLILKNLDLLGIRKKKKLTSEQRQALRCRLNGRAA